MLRIVHVVCTPNFAGVESHVASLASQQTRDGEEVTVIGGDATRMLAAGTFTWHPGETVWAAARVLRRLSADVVHAHMTRAEVAATLMSSRRPVVTTRHFARRRAASSGGLIAPLIASRISAQIAVSRFVADAIETPAVVIPGGVLDQVCVAPARKRDRVVLVLQRLEEEKRPGEALEAFYASHLWEESWRLQFAGSGSLADTLKAQAEALDLDAYVDFLGYREDIGRLLSRSQVLLAPCPIEAQGLAVIEAMARGLPVVASAGGGHLESVASVAGAAVYTPGKPAEAARWLRQLAGDPELCDRYGRALRHRQQTAFSLETQSRRVRALYKAVM